MSTDGSQDVATRLGVRVIDFDWDGKYPKKKQWVLNNVETSSNWIFFFDGDETPSTELIAELEDLFHSSAPKVSGYLVPVRYVFSGRVLKHGFTVKKLALFDRRRTRFPVIDDLAAPGMGELEGHYQPVVRGEISVLQGRLIHRDRDSVSTWFERHNKYSDWEAYIRLHPHAHTQVRGAKTAQGQLFDRLPFKAVAFFVYAFVTRLGFLDGRAGFDYALGLAFYRWQIGVKVREVHRMGKGAQP